VGNELTIGTKSPAVRAVVIGASAGGVEALLSILPGFSPTYPLPIMVVLHVPPDKRSILAEVFQVKCRLAVREAEDKEPIEGGTVYFAPPDYHMQVEPDCRLSLSVEEPVNFSRPSIDVLFETAAEAYGAGLVGVVLSGANADGARGLKAIQDAGGVGIVQRPSCAVMPAMPQAALDACPSAHVMSLNQITDYLLEAAAPC
jgi:two-component system, chemotaxis family, protein-glutamate methylesterase/glutaminase